MEYAISWTGFKPGIFDSLFNEEAKAQLFVPKNTKCEWDVNLILFKSSVDSLEKTTVITFFQTLLWPRIA